MVSLPLTLDIPGTQSGFCNVWQIGTLTAPSSAAFVFAGLGITFTPNKTGNFFFGFTGTMTLSAVTINGGLSATMVIGLMGVNGNPSTPFPSTGDAATIWPNRIAVNGAFTRIETAVAQTTFGDALYPISNFGVASGLVVGTQYWLDLDWKNVIAGNTANLTNCTVVVAEIQ